MNFTYYDDSGQARDSWDSTMEEFEGKLPAMVTVQLEFVNPSNPEAVLRFMSSVALPLAKNEYGQASQR